MTTRQSQAAGDRSTNVQAAGAVTIHQSGLSAQDAAEIALALVRPEFERLVDLAAETATARACEMVTERLLPKLMKENPDGIGTFGDPDVQYALMSRKRPTHEPVIPTWRTYWSTFLSIALRR
jgi:hypothetical protein